MFLLSKKLDFGLEKGVELFLPFSSFLEISSTLMWGDQEIFRFFGFFGRCKNNIENLGCRGPKINLEFVSVFVKNIRL